MMFNRSILIKLLICVIGVVAVVLVAQSFLPENDSPVIHSLTQAGTALKLQSSNSSFWKSANMEEKQIPEEVVKRAQKMKVEEKNIAVHERQVFCQISKPDSEDHQSFVLLLHGAAFTSQNWRELGTIQLLSAMGHTVVAIDLPGYGKSTGSPGDVNFIPDFVTELNNDGVLGTVKFSKPVIVSPSMSGGYSIPLLKQQVSKSAVDSFMSGFVPVAPVKTNLLTAAEAKNIQVPTLIIRGDKDESLGLSAERDLKEIPSSQIKVLPKARHPAYLDQPELFHKLLYNFLLLVNKQ